MRHRSSAMAVAGMAALLLSGWLCTQTLAAVPVQPLSGIGSFRVLPANDLGMHCTDQDDSIFSILPPFNVLHAQVIRVGTGTGSAAPKLLGPGLQGLAPGDIDVVYSAASNPSDPVGADSVNSTSQSSAAPFVFKGNFWDFISGVDGQPLGAIIKNVNWFAADGVTSH